MNYKEIIQNVLTNGVSKQATRYSPTGEVIPVENGTIGTFAEIFRHDMSEGFPLTTLRKMPWKSIRVELEGFIKGITKKSWYQDLNCKFWSEWANPQKVQEELKFRMSKGQMKKNSVQININDVKKQLQVEENDLGPIYGYQWRSFGEQYGEVPEYGVDCGDCVAFEKVNGICEGVGTDQLKSIVDKLRASPYDRRMVCSAWNPNQEHMMALPPCHFAWNVVVYGNKLNLIWHQRSCDLLLGVAANAASYALLLLLLAEEAGLEPGELVGTLADCHIYENHLAAAKEIVERSEVALPQVTIKRKEDGSFSIFDWTHDEVNLIGYNPQEKIDVGSVTI